MPQEQLAGSQERSALQRLSGSTPQDRTSALQRLSGSASRVPLLVNGVANSDSGRLQEVEIQYLEDNLQNNLAGSSGKASSSRAPVHERLSLPQSSPIRTLSQDRRHISITMDVPDQMEESGQSLRMEDQPVAPRRGRKPAAAKATGKAAGKWVVVDKPPPKKQVLKSPTQATAPKKRRTTRAQGSPRRRITTTSKGGAQTSGQAPPTVPFPSSTRQGSDFQTDPKILP